MAQNITLLGASYSAVPSVNLPKTGGGTASFVDVTDTTAAAADVASGKYFYTAAGVRTQGTSSGGGGGSGIATLLVTTSIGSVSTSSTTATDLSKSVTITGIYDYDALIIFTSVNPVVNGRHTASCRFAWLTASSNVGTKNGANLATGGYNTKISSSGVTTTRYNATAYGVYPNQIALSSANNGTATISMYSRYNSTQTGTLNGTYTTRVYGVKLYNLIGG